MKIVDLTDFSYDFKSESGRLWITTDKPVENGSFVSEFS
jgi:hypothetical protein